MNWIELHKEKPPKLAYYAACDVNSGEYLGELLWKPDYGYFVETRSRWSLNGISHIEEKIPNVTHWIERHNIALPNPAVVLEFEQEKVELSRREVEVFDGIFEFVRGHNYTDEEITLIDKVRDKFFGVLKNE